MSAPTRCTPVSPPPHAGLDFGTQLAATCSSMNGTLLPLGPRTGIRQRVRRPRHRCRRCPFLAPSGKCLDRTIRSGRCGDWVWYLRGSKQLRRIYIRPNDPRTPMQRLWRRRFRRASKKYSRVLTALEQDACNAAGAKLHSRPRLGQSGPLTGQQYEIRREYAVQAAARKTDTQKSRRPLQTKGILLSTSETRGGIMGMARGHHGQDTVRSGFGGRRWQWREGGKQRTAHRREALTQLRAVPRAKLRNRTAQWAVVRARGPASGDVRVRARSFRRERRYTFRVGRCRPAVARASRALRSPPRGYWRASLS